MQVPGTDQSERIFVGGLPYYLNEEQCRELLSSFGTIKTFDLVKDKETGNSKGWACVELFVLQSKGDMISGACFGHWMF